MLGALKSARIQNVMVFNSDALRWDFTPKSIKDMGVTFKTVSASLCTPTSFATFLTGLYPPKHGVYAWSNVLDHKISGLRNLKDVNFTLVHYGKVRKNKSVLHQTLGDPPNTALDKIKEPFVYLEDDQGGHIPYGKPVSYLDETAAKYFISFGDEGSDTLRKDYAQGIENSSALFQKRISTLKERGILDRTLLIFTSDHGEILGEHGGIFGHNQPPCPELVYVPMVFIHPALERKEYTNGVIRHIDLMPTIAGVLGKYLNYKPDGVDLLEQKKVPEYGMNFQKGGEIKFRKSLGYSALSLWDYNGGHVFHELGYLRSRIKFINAIRKDQMGGFWWLKERERKKGLFARWKTYRKALYHLWTRHLTYKKPRFSEQDAKAIIKDYLDDAGEVVVQDKNVDDAVKDRLKALGYLE